MSQMTVFSGRERRRRWSDEERKGILAEAFLPGACVAAVARRNDISTSLIYQWRDKLRGDAVPPAFVEAVIDDGSDQDGQEARPAMVIELSGGIKVVISASAPPSLAAAALRALR
jgi:transposase